MPLDFADAIWNGFGDALLNAAAYCPERVVPEISVFFVTDLQTEEIQQHGISLRDRSDPNEPIHRFETERMEQVFGPRLRKAMELLCQETDISQCDSRATAMILFARNYARRWLAENPQ